MSQINQHDQSHNLSIRQSIISYIMAKSGACILCPASAWSIDHSNDHPILLRLSQTRIDAWLVQFIHPSNNQQSTDQSPINHQSIDQSINQLTDRFISISQSVISQSLDQPISSRNRQTVNLSQFHVILVFWLLWSLLIALLNSSWLFDCLIEQSFCHLVVL